MGGTLGRRARGPVPKAWGLCNFSNGPVLKTEYFCISKCQFGLGGILAKRARGPVLPKIRMSSCVICKRYEVSVFVECKNQKLSVVRAFLSPKIGISNFVDSKS